MYLTYGEGVGPKSFVCGDVLLGVSIWPAWRALDYTWQRTYMCGMPCVDLAASAASNPMNIVVIALGLFALPYVSAILARANARGTAPSGRRRDYEIDRIEGGYGWGTDKTK